MKRTILTLLTISLSALAVAACGEDEGPDALTNGGRGASRTPAAPTAPDDTGGGDFQHQAGMEAPGAEFQPVDPAQVRAVGSPEVTSRLHGCGKLTIGSIAQLIESRGLNGSGQRPPNTQSGQQIFQLPDSPAALGAANYNGRVPEAPFASTSAISKLFDIFTMSAYDVVKADWQAPACPGVKVVENDKFTKDGVSCLIGKPASDEHVAIANDAIAKNPTDGAKIAIAALLAAAHTCQ